MAAQGPTQLPLPWVGTLSKIGSSPWGVALGDTARNCPLYEVITRHGLMSARGGRLRQPGSQTHSLRSTTPVERQRGPSYWLGTRCSRVNRGEKGAHADKQQRSVRRDRSADKVATASPHRQNTADDVGGAQAGKRRDTPGWSKKKNRYRSLLLSRRVAT